MQKLSRLLPLALMFLLSLGAAARAEEYHATATGDDEVPAHETPGAAQVHFWLSDDGASLNFQVALFAIENVTMAHIHLGAPGANGPVVALIYGPNEPGGGDYCGVVFESTLT